MIRIRFDRQKFIHESQMNWYAPRYAHLKRGELGEWLIAVLFGITFGWLWYPLMALSATRVTLRRQTAAP